MKKILKILFAISVLTLIFLTESSLVQADEMTSGTTGYCTWSLDGTVLTISGEGDMGDYDPSSTKSWGEVTQVIIKKGVTNIGDYAFYRCSSLTSVEIPDSVMSIGYCAFYDCSSLTSVEIPDSVTGIDYSAFNGCNNLTSMELPFIGNNSSFYHLGYIFGARTYSENNQYIPDSLTSIKIGNKCTRIASSAFYGCSGLTSVEIPNSVIIIGSDAFRGCSSLTNIKIPNSVTGIGSEAFCSCSSLTSVEIPDSVISIGHGVFLGCNSLTSMKLPFIGHDSLEYLFSVSSSGDNSNEVPESLKKIIISNECTSIASSAFDGCSNLTSVEIPASVMSIGSFAFCDCSSLTSIEIPQGVTSISSDTFRGCSSLTSVEIPKSVISIGYSAFDDCSGLKYVWYHGIQGDKEQIAITGGNYRLTSAAWHYNTYSSEHTYVTCEDAVCVYCDQTRAPESHLFSLNSGLTCAKCHYSQQPKKPDVESCISGKVSLVAKEGLEYSLDGINWQSSNVFEKLSANTTYIFYQRVKQSSVAQESELSEGLAVELKNFQAAPPAPLVSSFTDTTVILVPIENGEYSIDKVTWQMSNIFDNLLPGVKYTFYQRHVGTDTCENSEPSNGFSVTTDKAKQTLIPCRPSVQSIASSSITLVSVEGCEYSQDGKSWQSSTVFNNLSCGTEYTFYQRYKETSNTYAGKCSEGACYKTVKGTPSAPPCPTVSDKTHQSVILTKTNGYEYSRDGINWQTSNVFTGLEPETNYLFYQRKAETDTYFASPTSNCLAVKTFAVGVFEGISIKTKPNKLAYLEGEAFDATGIVVEAYYNNTVREVITDYAISGYSATPGTKTIVVFYQGEIALFTVEVQEHHDYETVITSATSSKNGSVVKKCGVCGDVASETTINYIKSVSLSTTEYTYNGSKKTPSVTVKDSAGKKLKEGTDYTLSYSSSGRKSIGRYSVKVTFKGNYSGNKTLYFTIGPKNPSSAKAILYGHDDVKVSWKKVSGASGYKVYYKKSTSNKWSSKTTTGASVKLTNLSDGVKYDIKIVTYKTVSGNKCYNAGKSTSIYTLKKITGVKVAKSGSKVKVSWSNIFGETGYQISMSTKKTRTSIVSTYKTTSGKSKTISATKKKTYYYKVRAYKVVDGKKIYGPWSSVVKYVRK